MRDDGNAGTSLVGGGVQLLGALDSEITSLKIIITFPMLRVHKSIRICMMM